MISIPLLLLIIALALEKHLQNKILIPKFDYHHLRESREYNWNQSGGRDKFEKQFETVLASFKEVGQKDAIIIVRYEDGVDHIHKGYTRMEVAAELGWTYLKAGIWNQKLEG